MNSILKLITKCRTDRNLFLEYEDIPNTDKTPLLTSGISFHLFKTILFWLNEVRVLHKKSNSITSSGTLSGLGLDSETKL